MKSNIKKIVRDFGLVVVTIFIIVAVFLFLNNYSIIKNKDLQIAPTNNTMAKPNTATSDAVQVGEGDDVYQQRQLRADYNNGSSSVGY